MSKGSPWKRSMSKDNQEMPRGKQSISLVNFGGKLEGSAWGCVNQRQHRSLMALVVGSPSQEPYFYRWPRSCRSQSLPRVFSTFQSGDVAQFMKPTAF